MSSFIQFESGRKIDAAREELREARAELLRRAEHDFKRKQEHEIDRKLRGEDQWMLPSVSEKIASMSESTSKSKKSKKKSKKERKHRKKHKSSDSSSSDEDDNKEIRKIKKRKKKRRKSSSSSRSSSQSNDEWIEKESSIPSAPSKPIVRDDWMAGMLLPTYSSSNKEIDNQKDKAERKNIDSYDPTKSTRELNPYWKDGGSGLPSFKKPKSDSDDDDGNHRKWKKAELSRNDNRDRDRKGNWRKKSEHQDIRRRKSRSRTPEKKYKKSKSRSRSSSPVENVSKITTTKSEDSSTKHFLTDQQMNELGAKIIKAEIMGNTELAQQLKDKLDNARDYRRTHKKEVLTQKLEKIQQQQQQNKSNKPTETVLLTQTNSKGNSRPLHLNSSEQWGGRQGRKMKSKKAETHTSDGMRMQYYADDGKYDIRQMFEKEKNMDGHEQDAEFVDIVAKHKNPNDNLDDIFVEKIQKNQSDIDKDGKERNRAIRQHHEMIRTLDTCDKCFDSECMQKQLIISMGTKVYLSLPWHEPLQTGHCLIVPVQHVSCSTHLDEDIWQEIVDYQKALCRMFASRSQDVIFFETVRYLHKRPHMVIHCIPNRNFELAPFYFKKAIQESEQEWSVNKQLVVLKEKNVRQAIPKQLPYFWVNFGMDNGFAHVIEDQERFPNNFAQETIGGLLNLDSRLWRRPRKEQNFISKVQQFADWWKPFDFSQ